MSEAGIHFEFYRHLANEVDDEPRRNGTTFGKIQPEYGENIDGFADLVLFEADGSPAVVIEAKAPNGSNRSRKEIDPYSPKVIRQAFRYAGDIGAPYFATFNGDRLVVFDAYEEGVPLLQRSTKSYDITSLEKFAGSFLDEIARIRGGEAKWDANDDAFVERIKSLHERITPDLYQSLADNLEEDGEFRADFEAWTASQGIEYEDADESDREDVLEEFAEQAAYLLTNKILFYKILESSPTYTDEVQPLAVSPFRVQADLEEYFNHIVEEIDFEAVFEHDDIYSEIPLNLVSEQIRDFIIELDEQDLTQFNSDVVGRIYEGVIPAERRKEMGEYYTPPAICDLIAQLTIDEAHDTVLDPACGSGGFLISAYNRKKELFPEQEGNHDVILDQLMGVDINRFPAHLSAINLALQDLTEHTENVNVEVSDFFDVAPDTRRFGRVVADASGSKRESGDANGAVGGFDAVVGNPPYIRYQSIGDKEKVRSHLSAVDAEYLSGFADIYCYFITHSAQFLKEGGKLGFIASDRWLSSRYGEDIQKFLLDNYKIEAVIQFASQAFNDALVGSNVIIVEKCDDIKEREENYVKFLKVQDNISVDDIADEIESEIESEKIVATDEYRMLVTSQPALRENNKWGMYYKAPPVYFELLRGKNICEIQEVANAHTGKKVGGNPYFYHRTEEWEELGLDQYTTPAIKASGQISKIRFDEQSAREWSVLDTREVVREALNDGHEFGDTEEEHVKEWLAKNGHEALLEYIEEGEEQGRHNHDRCERRDVWFNISEIDEYRQQLALPIFMWTAHRSVWNEARAFFDYQFHVVEADEDISDRLLCGILNSRLVWLARELEGRQASGQGMNRSELALYETEQLSIVDPRAVSDEEERRIVSAFENLMEVEDKSDDPDNGEEVEKARDELDRAVLSVIDAEGRVDDLKQAAEHLLEMRASEGGVDTEVLVEREQEREVIELEGVGEARESPRLSDY
jgi:type I restriction-modification system DNA methylase subunit